MRKIRSYIFLFLVFCTSSSFAINLMEQDGILLDSNLHIELGTRNILAQNKFILAMDPQVWTTLADQDGIKVLAHCLKADSENVVLEYRILDGTQGTVMATMTVKVAYTEPLTMTQKPANSEAGEITIGARVNRVHYQTTRSSKN
jgi:hypothetical protein